MGRLVVVILLGPQNRLVDKFWFRKWNSDEVKLKRSYAETMLAARREQEDALKLKVFRHALFGRFSTLVPSILWTPHQDVPLLSK